MVGVPSPNTVPTVCEKGAGMAAAGSFEQGSIDIKRYQCKGIHIHIHSWFRFVGITADGGQVAGIEYGMSQINHRVCLWDIRWFSCCC
jgi:hypothetical protein